jgi:hypothetical protein
MCLANRQKISSASVTISFVTLVLLLIATTARAQTTAFTYQGRLSDGGTPANGNYDLQFTLWDSLDGGIQIGPAQALSSIPVSGGIFTVTLDFGASAFPGADRFLAISVRPGGGAGAFTDLLPRQRITSTPYAVRSFNAAAADTAINATQLGGVTAANYVQTNDSRLTDARAPTAGSSNYIQNTTSPQLSSNFNISGNGTAGGTLSGDVVNATMQYNIKGFRAFALTGAGSNPATNTFAGDAAGAATTPVSPGIDGHLNSFFGFRAGASNTTGRVNSSFGANAGQSNTTGIENSFFGAGAGFSNTTENGNTFLGTLSDGAAGINHATAIGFQAKVTQSNSLVLGGVNGTNGVTVETKVGIGTTAPTSLLHVFGSQPPAATTSSSNNGTAAAPVLQVIGGTGGDTTVHDSVAGAGGSVLIQAGAGGKGTALGDFGGLGGSITLQAGTGGAGDVNGGPGGLGGSIILQAGDAGLSNLGTAGSILLQPGTKGAAAGGVGIGTTAPAARLHVVGNTAVMSGNVGIGTTTPANVLHLNGNSADFALTFTNQANTAGRRGYRIAFDTDRLQFQRADDSGNFLNNQMAIDPANGNVGIGNASPHTRLHVQGGDVFVAHPNSLVITSPNGSCWQIRVSDTGVLSAASVTCP